MKGCNVLAVLLSAHPSVAFPTMKGEPCSCPIAQGIDCTNRSAGLIEAHGSSTEKLASTWETMRANTASRGYMNPLGTLKKAQDPEYLKSMMDLPTDTRPASHQKITHGIGGHAKVHFEWCDNEYTGMFQKADNCVIRIANAAEPSKSRLNPTSWNPNMAIQCFRDGDGASPANLLTIWEIDGYNVIPEGKKDSCSFFDVPLSNHCGKRDNISMTLKNLFIGPFDKVDKRSLMLGVSSMAEATQEGESVGKPSFPFALVFQPHPDLAKVPCEFDNYTSQLDRVGKSFQGKSIYEIYAVHDPWYSRPVGKPDVKHIGSMILDSEFITSMYGDTQLFFRHRFFQDELNFLRGHMDADRAADWDKYSDPDTAVGLEHIKTEGAAWYQPYLPAKPPQSCAKASAIVV